MDGKEVGRSSRLVSMSRNGRFVAIRQATGVDLVDALGTNPRQRLDAEGIYDFAFVGSELWAQSQTGLRVYDSEGHPLTAPLGVEGQGELAPTTGERAEAVVWRGPSTRRVWRVGDTLESSEVSDDDPSADFVMPVRGGRLLWERDGAVFLTAEDGGERRDFPAGFRIGGASELFGGRVIALHDATPEREAVVVLQPTGARIHRVKLSPGSRVAFAETRGLAVAWTDSELVAIDLRYGRELGKAPAPMELAAAGVDAAGKFVVLAGFREGSDQLSVLHLPYPTAFSAPRAARPDPEPDAESELGPKRRELGEVSQPPERDAAGDFGAAPEPDAEDGGAAPVEEAEVEVPDWLPVALGPLPVSPRPPSPGEGRPYERADQHIEDLVELIAARTAKAIAEAWDSGRLSLPSLDALPFEREVNALVGGQAGSARAAVEMANRRVADIATRVAQRAQASLAAGMSLPFFEVVAEFGLGRVAAQALVVALAPQVRGELARLYGVLANDEGRPICDRFLVELILGGSDDQARHDVARELETDAPLIHYGLVRVLGAAPDMYLFAPLTVDPVLIARLRGHPFAAYETGTVTEIHRADRELADLAVAPRVKRDLVVALAEPPADGRAVRVVLRGRPGSGRTAVLAALAAQVGRAVALIDCERLPRDGRALAQRLRTELRRARLRGALPCVSALEVSEGGDSEGIEHLREVFRSHPGPILFRTSPEYRPALEPGYVDVTIPPLSEGARAEFWTRAAERAGLPVSDPGLLASRFRIGPGTIEQVVRGVALRRDASGDGPDDYTSTLDKAARQHIASRLSSVATRVSRLARWEQVALPEDLLDSIREFVGRVRHRRRVYESWGFDAKMSTSRGLTALFYGSPGTGKTMVAGLIARELGLDLYRVDLARITSKWVGETEKNLAQVFDAAEDGQAVIVFDEADSLFAKRTEVKSSVDRYANLEVNYLLQRLDSFEGIAILTTNLEGSIDNAFKRRLSLRLAFPFPDEEMRVRLWSAHMPPELPTAGDFDFEELARRFPMSGGYIRNSTIRAAFLAAQENLPLSQEHLLRAISLEYREMGKLSASGRIE